MNQNLTIEEKISHLSTLPLEMIKNEILLNAKEELNEKITFKNVGRYKTLIILHTNNFIKAIKTPISQNKPFSLFG